MLSSQNHPPPPLAEGAQPAPLATQVCAREGKGKHLDTESMLPVDTAEWSRAAAPELGAGRVPLLGMLSAAAAVGRRERRGRSEQGG